MFLALLGAVWLLVPGMAQAANGDDDGEVFPSAEYVGAVVPNRAGWSGGIYFLCDDYDVGDADPSACAVFDLNSVGGLPDLAIIEITAAAGCSAAYTADVNTFLGYNPATPAATTDEHDVVVLDATTTRAVIPWSASLDRYIAVDLATLTGCTDLTVTIEVRYEKKSQL
jgi:hypothetical protein